jgi:hypothetical protein
MITRLTACEADDRMTQRWKTQSTPPLLNSDRLLVKRDEEHNARVRHLKLIALLSVMGFNMKKKGGCRCLSDVMSGAHKSC